MKETKHYTCDFAIKSMEENGVFAGYASVFNTVDNQKDVMLPGAFAKFLQSGRLSKDVKLLWQHRADEPIGILNTVREDAYGLYVSGALLLDVARGREAYALLKTGAINGLSIGYKATDFSYDRSSGIRYLKQVELWEVSLVTFPANEKAGVTHLKSDARLSIRTLEHVLRDAGYSRKEAKVIAAGGLKGLSTPRDAEEEALLNALDRALSILQS